MQDAILPWNDPDYDWNNPDYLWNQPHVVHGFVDCGLTGDEFDAVEHLMATRPGFIPSTLDLLRAEYPDDTWPEVFPVLTTVVDQNTVHNIVRLSA